MTKRTAAAPRRRLNANSRMRFLDHLAETANVSASAKVAGFSSSAAYGERRRSPEFRKAWTRALAEGYARLEADLLAEALQAAHGKTADATLKARAQKHRLGIALLNAHRSAVKGETSGEASRQTASDLPTLKAQLILKLTQMRDRAGLPLEPRRAPKGESGGADADS